MSAQSINKRKELVESYTIIEEIIHSASHGIGALMSIVGLVVLVVNAVKYGDNWHIVSFSIYGSTLLLLYLSSTIYHGLTHPQAKQVFQLIDHSAIFLLIAGSYTPFALVSLRGALGWGMFALVWTIALIGIVMVIKGISFYRLEYILMGWVCVAAYEELAASLSSHSMLLLVIGGITYTIGFVFYTWEKLPYNHAIFHGFVIGGSVAHYFSILDILYNTR